MTASHDLFAEAQKLQHAQRFQEAEALYRRLVYADPNHVGGWHLLGMVCLAQNKLADAADAFQCVLAIAPDHVDAMMQYGIILARQQKITEAVTQFRQAIELRPQSAWAHNNLGVALTQMGEREEGLACYREAAELQADYVEAHFNLAVALAERNQNQEAIASYQRALQVKPDYVDVLFNLGMLLISERRGGEAVAYFEHLVRIQPNNSEAHNNLGLALADVGRFREAVASCDEALKLKPLDVKAHMNRGNAFSSLGEIDTAVTCYDFALRLQPDYAHAHWNRALALLAQGDHERGWAEYEWRWKKPDAKGQNFRQPFWNGSSLEGKTILLWIEQGLGDTLQFVRYATMLKQQGATVWLVGQTKLLPLLSTCEGIDRLFGETEPLPVTFDCHAPLMSLPFLCKTTLANVPAATPYLSADAVEVERWRTKLSGSRHFKIGIAWQGNPKNPWDRYRSFPLHWFRSLAMTEGVELYSLQKGHGTEQIPGIRFPVTDLGSGLDENGGAFQETAALMQALDLVITCDSSLAHLAGALGVHVWVAMSAVADWRWLRDREDTLWYPTMRLFRQEKLGDWRPVFERMREEAMQLCESTSPTILVEVGAGELLDKLTILQIKSERIADADKLRNVRAELTAVEATRQRKIPGSPNVAALVDELKAVNEQLWEIENCIRDCEKAEDFGKEFVRLARLVYQTNDRRAGIKKQLNELLGANFREEKEYHG